jgi:hypothetical protein
MKRQQYPQTLFKWLSITALIAGLIVLLAVSQVYLLRSGTRAFEGQDFLAYWSTASLLAHGQNPYDQDSLLALEKQQGWPGSAPFYSWNRSWLHLILLPLGALPFRQAAALWFVLNPFLMGLSALLIWHAISPRRGLGIVALVLGTTFLFSRSLYALLEGQINTLALLGCAGFVALAVHRSDLLAGVMLALTTVKRHLSYLLLPALLWTCLARRRWRAVIGFRGCLVLLLLVVTCICPSWGQTYFSLLRVSASPLTAELYTTPTIRGILLAGRGVDIGAWGALACLVVFMTLIALRGRSLDLPTVVSVSIITGLPTAPFGWSTDQILLLLPLLQIAGWLPSMPPKRKRTVAFSLILLYTYAMWVWLVRYHDWAFFILPPAVGLLWGFSYVQLSMLHPRAGNLRGQRQSSGPAMG